MAERTRIVSWNGKDVPAELRELPAGRYLVEAVEDEAPRLSSDDEAGIEAALESYRQGRAVAADRAREIDLPGRALSMMAFLKWIVYGSILLLVVAVSLHWNVPDWAAFTVFLAVLAFEIVHIIWSDKEATKQASQSALEHRIKNA